MFSMAQIDSHQIVEAKELLEEVRSWKMAEIEELPRFYRQRAKRYRRLMQRGED